jgi:hypothetical protein
MFGRGFLWWKTQSWKGKVFLFSLSLSLSLSVCQSLSRASPSGASRESEGRRESRERLRRRIVAKGSYPAPSLGLREVYSSILLLLLLLRFVPTASLL